MLRLFVGLVLVMNYFCAHAASNGDANCLIPQISVGDHFSNVFSIAVAINAEGFDVLARRNGGTGDYTVKQLGANQDLTFEISDLYDGLASEHGENIIRDGGCEFSFIVSNFPLRMGVERKWGRGLYQCTACANPDELRKRGFATRYASVSVPFRSSARTCNR